MRLERFITQTTKGLRVDNSKVTGEPIDIDAGFDRIKKRFPKIIARLAE